ncbi:hypothetical protein HNQ80_004960 [Anaerosolibacter carboniphilus]|uniref:Uncharacterized protein n=1 Tax=Anaerosolibacter carboniphilus TaxID=1417629 RepID=A0A841L961_9FIRM|nr:hypothetical protein [Anaerosolibacter carboniphilus]MBB6218785.1 hypothetical protein [Anaerosolibacter carboniphilus]
MGYKRWSSHEENFLIIHYEEKSIFTIAQELKRSEDSVHKKAKQLGLTKERKLWSQREVEFLIENWGKVPKTELGERMGRSATSIRKKAFEFQLGPERIGNGEFLTSGDIGYLLDKDPNLIYRWIVQGDIKGRRFGDKGIFQIKPKDFLQFLNKFPHRWDGSKARIDLIKPYFCISGKEKAPLWFLDKIAMDIEMKRKQRYLYVSML